MSTDEKKTTAAQAESTEEIKDEVEVTEINSDDETKAEKKPADKKPGKKDKDKKAADKKAEEKPAEPTQDAKAAAEIAALNDKYLRLYAEYDNFRRRSQKEKEGIYGDAKADTLKEFLPVYDNLVRALATATQDEAYAKGVEMIMAQFNKTMEKLGVTKIESLGQKFDPELHNAVMHVDDETRGENEIAEVFQEGFKLGDKVIRFAMVKVAN
ncbi:MAG: nucleotide exchange factor GrpE [Oscillospiraceae bacterium]|nr:nucleotide exchange factor GrpE [Oscillospiraceae bacterium]